jgi:ankyrin repeat protein
LLDIITHLAMLSMTEQLIEAVQKGDLVIVTRLLDEGVEVNAVNCIKRTPLMEAVAYRHPHIVVLLLGRDADPNASDNNGITPLMEAA